MRCGRDFRDRNRGAEVSRRMSWIGGCSRLPRLVHSDSQRDGRRRRCSPMRMRRRRRRRGTGSQLGIGDLSGSDGITRDESQQSRIDRTRHRRESSVLVRGVGVDMEGDPMGERWPSSLARSAEAGVRGRSDAPNDRIVDDWVERRVDRRELVAGVHDHLFEAVHLLRVGCALPEAGVQERAGGRDSGVEGD
jgi:hypothetical protein